VTIVGTVFRYFLPETLAGEKGRRSESKVAIRLDILH
jgi:hypothetical protein